MRGFPKHLNSRADYEYIRQNFPIEKWKPEWDALLDNLQEWYCTGKLNSVDAGVTDDTHRVVTIAGQGGKNDTYWQHELRRNDSAKLYRLALPEEYVRAVVNAAK